MKISEVVSLLKAGYSKKEIEELRAAENIVVTPAIEEMPLDHPEAPAPQTEAVPAAAAAPPVQDNSEVLQAIKDLTKAIQVQNLRNDELHQTKPETAVDILGSIIQNNKTERKE